MKCWDIHNFQRSKHSAQSHIKIDHLKNKCSPQEDT